MVTGRGARLGAAARQPLPRLGSRAGCRGSRPMLIRGADGIVHFSNLRLVAPSIRHRRQGLSPHATAPSISKGSGTQAQYGAVRDRSSTAGIDRPRLAIRLERAERRAGPRRRAAQSRSDRGRASPIAPTGGSTLGPFTGNGVDPAAAGPAGDRSRSPRSTSRAPARRGSAALRSRRLHRPARRRRRRARRPAAVQPGRQPSSGSRSI